MEVLTEVDRSRIETLRARDELFWLDLIGPSDGELDVAGELLGLHPLAIEDTREFGQRPKLDRYSDAVLLVYWSTRVVTGELQRQADDLMGLTSTYFNANQNRLNLTVTRLTIVATFFLIWTLVTSFFGQNFKWMTDHIASLPSFVWWDGVGLLIPTVLTAIYFWRRRREWL